MKNNKAEGIHATVSTRTDVKYYCRKAMHSCKYNVHLFPANSSLKLTNNWKWSVKNYFFIIDRPYSMYEQNMMYISYYRHYKIEKHIGSNPLPRAYIIYGRTIKSRCKVDYLVFLFTYPNLHLTHSIIYRLVFCHFDKFDKVWEFL